MREYQILIKWKILHNYYQNGVCRGMVLQPDQMTSVLLHRRACFIKQLAVNEWVLLGEMGTEWEQEDELVLEVKVTDNKLYYVTEGEIRYKWPVLPGEVEFGLELIQYYEAKSLMWEYICVPRVLREGGQLIIKDKTGGLDFSVAEEAMLMGQKAARITTLQPVKLCEVYNYQLVLMEKRNFGEKVLCRQVPYPEPGRFGGEIGKVVRQIMYY